MSSLPLSAISAATVRASRTRGASPAVPRPATPQVAAIVSTPIGHRRWTVVIPRRLTERAVQAGDEAEAFHAAQPAPAGPLRFGPQATMFGLIAAIASGLYVYSAKHAAATLDGQIARAFDGTGIAHRQTSLLRAEWTLLNNPDRLQPLSARYLSLQPLATAQYAQLETLHARLPGVLYGPPAPEAEEDAGAPVARGRRLVAMALAAAPAAEAVPDAPPVVAPPARAMRVLAHPLGATDADADARDAPDAPQGGQTVGMDAAPSAAPAARIRNAGVLAARAPAHGSARPHPSAAVPQDAPRLVQAEPRPRAPHGLAMLRPELVHELMLQRDLPHDLAQEYARGPAPAWSSRPHSLGLAMAAPTHRTPVLRSEPPHGLTLPADTPLRVAAASPATASAAYRPRARMWYSPPAAAAPPRLPYRPPYWAYNAPPYGGAYGGTALPPPVPVYPGYQ